MLASEPNPNMPFNVQYSLVSMAKFYDEQLTDPKARARSGNRIDLIGARFSTSLADRKKVDLQEFYYSIIEQLTEGNKGASMERHSQFKRVQGEAECLLSSTEIWLTEKRPQDCQAYSNFFRRTPQALTDRLEWTAAHGRTLDATLEKSFAVLTGREFKLDKVGKAAHARAQGLSSQIISFLTQITGLRSQNDKLKSQIKANETQIGSLSSHNKRLQSETEALQSRNKDLQSRNKSLETDKKTLEHQCQTLESENGGLKSSIKALTTELNELKLVQSKEAEASKTTGTARSLRKLSEPTKKSGKSTRLFGSRQIGASNKNSESRKNGGSTRSGGTKKDEQP